MSLVHKKIVLKLNKHWIPFDIATPFDIMPALFSGTMYPVNLGYENEDDDGPTIIELIENLEDWMSLPVTENDIYLNTPRMKFKIPSVVVMKNYDKIKKWEPRLTKTNIMTRDSGICQYTGKYVGKQGNIDHVIPVAKGGKNTWENMVWCDKELNTKKADKTPQEAGLKLIRQPFKPNTFSVDYNKLPDNPNWRPFLKNFLRAS